MTPSEFDYIETHRDRFLSDLKDWCSIPSVSADSHFKNDVVHAAEWISKKLTELGFQSEIIPTAKHPVVIAERKSSNPTSKTLLIYGHYDVQPADPYDLWHSDPFTPVIKDGYIFARGVSDMKGPTLISVFAIEALLKTYGDLPVNIKFLIEGEEEIGSPSINDFLSTYKDRLKSDISLNLDAGMADITKPGIVYGLRGLASFELKLTGPDHDLHSGSFGGAVQNPAQALSKVLAGLHDEKGHVLIQDFYASVRQITAEEHEVLLQTPLTSEKVKAFTGVNETWGEPEFNVAERLGARPTLEINGMISGYTGEGNKTIIPSWASTKISMRLVPDQDPHIISELFKKHLEKVVPSTVKWDLKITGGSYPFIMDRDLKELAAFSDSIFKAWDIKPIFRREGGSIPIVNKFKSTLGLNSILSGFSTPDNNAHGPNENLCIDSFFKGIKTVCLFLEAYAK